MSARRVSTVTRVSEERVDELLVVLGDAAGIVSDNGYACATGVERGAGVELRSALLELRALRTTAPAAAIIVAAGMTRGELE